MSSPPTIKLFKGTNGEECDEFIRAIRETAWKEGEFCNPGWIAGFASFHFSHRALSWHSRLPQDVRRDWEKLEVALLDRWAPPEEDDEPRIEPTPAAAPSLNRSIRADRPLQGVLKVVVDGSNENSYLKINDGRGTKTNNMEEALRVRCNSLSNTTLLERTDGSRHSWLAIKWSELNLDLKNGSTQWGLLVLVDSLSLKASWGMDTQYQLASCTLSTDGEVIPVWEKKDTSKIAIGIFLSDGGILYIAADPDAYPKNYSGQKKVKIFIEPID